MLIIEKGKKLIKYIFDSDYRFLHNDRKHKYDSMSDEKYLKRKFKAIMGTPLNLENPRTFNEKLQWLKLYDRDPSHTRMVDKYLVRKYIAEKLGEEYLIPFIGAWDDPDEINFDDLPNQFVLKCNHNSGLGMCICKDKSQLDISSVKMQLRNGIRQNYFLSGREWPYKDVPRKIICEQFMVDESGCELKDYKIYCFNGKAKLMLRVTDRFSDTPAKANYFDRNHKEILVEWGFLRNENPPEWQPEFDEMFALADKLSQGMAHVRVDFYLINKQIYFGELTFFDGSGFDSIAPKKYDELFGSWIQLPDVSCPD